MNKASICMSVTAILSVICFNFNKLMHMALSYVCANMTDDAVTTMGPYTKLLPVVVEVAMVDGVKCTNKLNLLLNWYWDPVIGGFDTKNLLIPGSKYIIKYKKRYSNLPDKTYVCNIDIGSNIYSINRQPYKQLVFDEVKLL